MSENKIKVSNRAPMASYSRPKLASYGSVTKLTATGSVPGVENTGNPQRRD